MWEIVDFASLMIRTTNMRTRMLARGGMCPKRSFPEIPAIASAGPWDGQYLDNPPQRRRDRAHMLRQLLQTARLSNIGPSICPKCASRVQIAREFGLGSRARTRTSEKWEFCLHEAKPKHANEYKQPRAEQRNGQDEM
jgi:hypothetical protein